MEFFSFRFDKDQIGYAKAALSNMIGGIGYFHGQSLVSSDYTTKGPLQYWEASLYTGTQDENSLQSKMQTS